MRCVYLQKCYFRHWNNQSIENQLAHTDWVKEHEFFLKKCNSETLFLIDEFGTGSDPELGGARQIF